MSKLGIFALVILALIVVVLGLFWSGVFPLSLFANREKIQVFKPVTDTPVEAPRLDVFSSNQTIMVIDKTPDNEEITLRGVVESINEDPIDGFYFLSLRSSSQPLALVNVRLGKAGASMLIRSGQTNTADYKTEKTVPVSAFIGTLTEGTSLVDVKLIIPDVIGLDNFEQSLVDFESQLKDGDFSGGFIVNAGLVNKVIYY